VTRRLTWVFVLGVALSLAALIASNDQDAIATLLRHDIGALAVKITLAVSAGGLAVVVFRHHFSKALEPILFWVVIGLLLVIGYTYRFELRDVTDRVIAELMPGHVASHGSSAEVVRGRGGDFALSAHINGAKVAMVLDTGASSVVLTQADRGADLYGQCRHRQRPHPCGAGDARPHCHRRPDRALGAGFGGADRPAQEQPLRHELSQPARELGSAWRQTAHARHAVSRRSCRNDCQTRLR
jgi:hypothetical protein